MMKEAGMQSGQTQIGRYRISGELGRGAMGVVYRATDPSIGRSVAIKTIRIRDIDDEQQRERLRERLFREARSAGVLSHPNIVTIYDMDEDDGVAYITMAFVNGPTLEAILASGEPLSGSRMLRILRQTAMALDYAHSKGIVHRDVKPANIMTDEDGSVKITDFGIARITASAHASNETKTISGTPNYMSPEQVQGVPVDGKSDQFSLAVIAYEILTGERPFAGEHLSTIVYRIVTENPPAAFRLNGTLTPRIDEVLQRGLAKDPAHRFPNCSAFVGALELACAESRGWKTLPPGAAADQPTVAVERHEVPVPVAAPAAAALPPGPRPPAVERKGPTGVLAVLMSLLLVSGLAALFIYQSGLGGSMPQPAPKDAVAEEVKRDPLPSPAPAETLPPAAETPAPAPPQQEAKPFETKPAETKPAEDKPAEVKTPEVKPVSTRPAEIKPRLQDIFIATSPSGAKAVLDENAGLSCVTPCQLHGARGTHRVSVYLPGYLNEFREIHIEDGALDIGTIALKQPMGTLMLTSNPAGARILINGAAIEKLTPAEIPLKPGAYTVTVEKDGASRTEHIQLRETPFYLRIPLNR